MITYQLHKFLGWTGAGDSNLATLFWKETAVMLYNVSSEHITTLVRYFARCNSTHPGIIDNKVRYACMNNARQQLVL